MKRSLLLALLVLLMAGSAWGDVAPEVVENYGSEGVLYAMCDAQPFGSTGVCTRDGDQIVLNAAGFASLTFYSMQATTTTYTCDIYSRDQSHDTAVAGNGFKINATSLSESQEVLTLSGPFSRVWVNCTAMNDNQVTIHVLAKKK